MPLACWDLLLNIAHEPCCPVLLCSRQLAVRAVGIGLVSQGHSVYHGNWRARQVEGKRTRKGKGRTAKRWTSQGSDELQFTDEAYICLPHGKGRECHSVGRCECGVTGCTNRLSRPPNTLITQADNTAAHPSLLRPLCVLLDDFAALCLLHSSARTWSIGHIQWRIQGTEGPPGHLCPPHSTQQLPWSRGEHSNSMSC